jgi:hypothetical protein
MRKSRISKSVMVVLVVLGFGVRGGELMAQETPATDQSRQTLTKKIRVRTGRLTGKLMHGGTRSSLAGHTLTLRAPSGITTMLQTTAGGIYMTPELEEGEYVLTVAENVSLKLDVDRHASIIQLDVLVPPAVLSAKTAGESKGDPPARDRDATPPGGFLPGARGPASIPIAGRGIGTMNWVLIVAGVAATSGGIFLVTELLDDDDETTVSPSMAGPRR